MDQDQNTKPAEQPFPAAPMTEKSNLSMLVGVGAFIIVLAGLGWYFIQGGTTATAPVQPSVDTGSAQAANTTPTATTTEDAAAVALSAQGSSDVVSDINADLNATDLSSLNDIDKI